ncbi:helix-turn-helix domain-containing protein [Chitinophaga sp. 30R24]|uniref:helix-turn-helix domain-containing protein n=1 Tax=Chitinophaga sp. 30R24 TaxID=3248838 RepID=UPI003B986B17
MSVPYYIHAGARLRRILRQKEIVILQYAKKAGLTPQGLYRYFSQAVIKKNKLEKLLDAVPVTMTAFHQWDSLNHDSLHQGELLLLYLAQHRIKPLQLADRLQLHINEMYDWFDCPQFNDMQLQQLQRCLELLPEHFTGYLELKQDTNWIEAYLDKCMEVQQYMRRLDALEKRLHVLESR